MNVSQDNVQSTWVNSSFKKGERSILIMYTLVSLYMASFNRSHPSLKATVLAESVYMYPSGKATSPIWPGFFNLQGWAL